MPIIRAGSQLLYYAHVPKCGGSSIESYLAQRFGEIAFVDTRHTSQAPHKRWSRTSPQHIDLATLNRLFPESFFDHAFTVVRHPVGRLISAYHFQLEIEQSTPANVSFSFWLEGLASGLEEDPFLYDNHTRPMAELVPEGAQVFHLEHGIDAMVPWLDEALGNSDGPRAIGRVNERKSRKSQKVEPSPTDLDLIAELYAADFDRFGYALDQKAPLAAAPKLESAYIEARDAEIARLNAPGARASSWIKDRISKVTRSPF